MFFVTFQSFDKFFFVFLVLINLEYKHEEDKVGFDKLGI